MKLCYVAQVGLKLLNSRDLASAFQVAEISDSCHYTWLVTVFYVCFAVLGTEPRASHTQANTCPLSYIPSVNGWRSECMLIIAYRSGSRRTVTGLRQCKMVVVAVYLVSPKDLASV